MPAIFSTIVLPAVTKGPGASVRLLGAACEMTADYLGRRTAIACLQVSTTAHLMTSGWPVFR